ncbi:hypothetical protein PHYPSEUDO_015232 [Phytophthora pseudosyringae]|uniref:RxLR effector protein n=1 Tax=Phytophthora pseudosyringae TaxID=221518 RepID=A0A8T1W457_9STRA|nr:hypothetical protein PHYPSEUDO_015232 [Phytophthora pseudosyringae]
MRLQFLVLLALAAVLAGADADATTVKTQSIMNRQSDARAKRHLRSDGAVGVDDEERAWYHDLAKLIKPNTKFDNPVLAKLAGKSLNGAYKSLGLKNMKTVDEIFSSSAFATWTTYMSHLNANSGNRPSTVAKFFSKKFGDKQAAEMFATASKSSDDVVSRMGAAYEYQLLRQWAEAGKTSKQVTKISPSLEGEYATLLVKLAVEAEGKSTQLAKANAAKKAARATRLGARA